MNLTLYELLRISNEPIVVAFDSTGVRVHKVGGWVECKHKKKWYVKIHLAVDVETEEALALIATVDITALRVSDGELGGQRCCLGAS